MSTKHSLLKVFSVIALLAMIFSNIQPSIAQAQSGGGGERQKVDVRGGGGVNRKLNAKSGKLSFIGPEKGQVLAAAEALNTSIRPQDPALALAKQFAPEFGIQDPGRDLALMKNQRAQNGRITARYQQKYQGIPVMGGELIVNTNENGDLYSMNGEVSPDLSLSTQPVIDAATAQSTALQEVAKSYQKSAKDFVATEPQLWIYDESLLKESTRPAELVWRMDVTPNDAHMPVRELVLVNAQDGSVSLHFNQIDTEWKADTAPTSTPEPPQPTEPPVATDVPESAATPAPLQAGQSSAEITTGNTLYVATTGSDGNLCTTSGAPCATINGAIGKASSGDTILVAIGTYTGSGTEAVLINKNIMLSGGWANSFSNQNGYSVVDGQDSRRVIYNYNTNSTLDHLIIQHGHPANAGGAGIYNWQGSLTINNSLVTNNRDNGYYGGGIYSDGNLIINNSSIRDNSSAYGGGIALYMIANTLTINNSTIADNHADGVGGGIFINNYEGWGTPGTITIQNSTLVNNSAQSGGGISNLGGTTPRMVNVKNSILARNIATFVSPSSAANCEGTIKSLDHSLVDNTLNCIITTNNEGILNSNAGITTSWFGVLSYYALLPGSPAIDSGLDCLSTDQRGITRPQGAACDMGAFEHRGNSVTPAYIFVSEGTPQSIAKGKAASANLKVSVLDVNGDGVSGAVVTFTAPGSGASAIFSDTGTNTTLAVTNADGLATAPLFSANNIVGSYVIHATVTGVIGSADFQITNGAQVKTYTANNTSVLPGTFLCDRTQPNCTNNADPHADAAHKYAIGTYDLYANQFARDSIDNNGMTIISTVHFYYGYANAFWSGDQMVYGDAYGFPLADDVVAHELTHGVTQYESDLFYYFQSGAINESLSDVFGEYYDQTNGLGNDTIGVKWQLGEDVSGMGALRSMSDPTIYGDPDMMTSPNYFIGGDDNGGVHYNSGVNNKAVYLMVDGDTFNAKTITGIGWDKVGAIYYEVNANLLTSGADYSDLYYAVQQACTNLIGGQKGITSADCVQVKNALDAVEMNYRQKNIANFEDPGFEYSLYSDYYWAQDSTNFYSPLCSMAYCGGMNGTAGPRTGSVWGWFGGTTATETAWLSQPVYFPRGYSSIKLNFYLWIGRADKGSDANDRFMAQVDGVTVFTANATQKSSYSSYKLVSVDVNRFAKNSLHTVRFISVTSGQRVDFNLDDVSLTDTSSRIIRGNVGTAGAVLSYSNNGMKAVTSDANGNYTIAVPYNWSGTVTPWRACYTFTPGNLVYTKLVADRGGQNYSVVFNGPNCGVSAGLYNDADPNWTYIGKWASYSGSGPYNSDLHYTGKPGDWAWFIFNGTQFILNYSQATNRGSFEVYVDGDKIATVDANGTTQWQKTFTSPVYPAGMHVAQFKNIGGKGPVFDVDAIDIRNTAAPGAGMYDDGYFNWRYTGKWASYSGSGPYNNTLHYSGTTGNIAAFMFTGTQFILSYTQSTNRGSFEVYVDGNKITTVNANGTTQWQKVYVSPVYSSGTHEVQLKNIGGSGSVLDVDALQIFNGVIPGKGTYDDNDANWSYSGSWPTFSGAGPYNDTLRYTGKVGNTASFPFSGTQFTLSYTQNTNRGSFEVYVDGSKIATINANGALQWRKTFTSPILAAGVHVAQIKNIGGTNPVIDVDAIEVLDTPIPAAGKYDDNDSWFYTGKWSTFTGSGPANNTLHYTATVGNTASFTFSGTQFTLSYTQNTNRGSFEVYVDGGKIATVNANGTLQWQKTFTSPILTDSTHVVQLKNIGGTSSVTDIDAIEILDTPVPGAAKYDDANSNWFYYGTWSTFSGSGPYDNSLRYTTGVGNWAWFPFDGTQFILTYTQNTNRGSFEVYVDGSRIATIVATGILQWQKTYTSPTFTAGTHVVQFKNIGGSGSMTDVDAIQVLP